VELYIYIYIYSVVAVLSCIRTAFLPRDSFGISPTTFEVIEASMSYCSLTLIVVVVIYCPGGDAITSQFYTELTAVLEQLANYSCPVVVTGDLNIHLDVVDDRDTRRLAELLDTFGLSQLVSEPTHRDVILSTPLSLGLIWRCL